jgi:hypothetical protein
METNKLNGFNNGRDTTDGIGGQPPFYFLEPIKYPYAKLKIVEGILCVEVNTKNIPEKENKHLIRFPHKELPDVFERRLFEWQKNNRTYKFANWQDSVNIQKYLGIFGYDKEKEYLKSIEEGIDVSDIIEVKETKVDYTNNPSGNSGKFYLLDMVYFKEPKICDCGRGDICTDCGLTKPTPETQDSMINEIIEIAYSELESSLMNQEIKRLFTITRNK